ncbi:lysine--tRNA ligase [Beggiatoa leptomitoformis]|uniref:Lysine--tRNA ligase n=1 Tax=Beggiatoa leptomitoformis TaxID=288004 RepID=A0A2N9YB83_9GAMM|nr:lysine--tRNA ligase [Beggiatoa leptomitoformis]ALG66930.1 lysine--tRNA ligase [Beggiatoa leptomitoformis]AUI67704.1 lysine--tRNA ligase [Beggiatoa leptomitoformis]
MTEQLVPTAEPQDENEQIALRREKLAAIRQAGIAFPNDFRPNSTAQLLHDEYASQDASTLELRNVHTKIAGRIMTRRIMGKAAFVHIQDMTGRMQLYLKKEDLPENLYETFKHWDIGDIIGVQGTVFKTKTGELSVKVSTARLLSKALRSLPEKFHGLTDQETCYRQRYLDLIMNEKTRNTFKLRSQIISYTRQFLIERDFLEVETPMMHVIPGGAAARPFVTHHNALDMPLYLRIAPELYLKRLVVGGFERVFELNRNFRNEGVSTRHNPEFTMLEFYQAYANYHHLMDLTEELFRGLAETLLGSTLVPYQEDVYDFGKPFERISVKNAILKHNPDICIADLESLNTIRALAKRLGVHPHESDGVGKIQIEIFDKTVEHLLKDPTFVTEYPTEISPLARMNDKDPSITDRFELFIGGREIANGFSELNDPEDQAERFRQQVEAKQAGDEEAMHYDADYIQALEYGLPPTAGEGIGIDRLVMLLTNQPSIRDVLLFPHLRLKHE